MLPPPLVVRSLVGGRDRLETRWVAQERQRGQKLDRQRRRIRFQRLAQIVQRQTAPPVRQHHVRGSARSEPFRAATSRYRRFTLADALDDAVNERQSERGSAVDKRLTQRRWIVIQTALGGGGQIGQ